MVYYKNMNTQKFVPTDEEEIAKFINKKIDDEVREERVDFILNHVLQLEDNIFFNYYTNKKINWNLNRDGYLQTTITYDGKAFVLQQQILIWILNHNVWPKQPIHHIDKNRQNNNIENLILISHREKTLFGQKLRNKNGYFGIDKRHNKWCVQFTLNGVDCYGGSYFTKEEAAKAYDEIIKKNSSIEALPYLKLNFPDLKK